MDHQVGGQIPQHPDLTAYSSPTSSTNEAPNGIQTPAGLREAKSGESHDFKVKVGKPTLPGQKAIEANNQEHASITQAANKAIEQINQHASAPLTENHNLSQLPSDSSDSLEALIAQSLASPEGLQFDLSALTTMESADVKSDIDFGAVDLSNTISGCFELDDAFKGTTLPHLNKNFNNVETKVIDGRGKGNPIAEAFHKDPNNIIFSLDRDGIKYDAAYSPKVGGFIINQPPPDGILSELMALAQQHHKAQGLSPPKAITIIIVDNETWKTFQTTLLELNNSQKSQVEEKTVKKDEPKKSENTFPSPTLHKSNKKDKSEEKRISENDRAVQKLKDSIKSSIRISDQIADEKASENRHKLQEKYRKDVKEQKREKSEEIKSEQKKWEESKS